jgi:hypothetical protein
VEEPTQKEEYPMYSMGKMGYPVFINIKTVEDLEISTGSRENQDGFLGYVSIFQIFNSKICKIKLKLIKIN